MRVFVTAVMLASLTSAAMAAPRYGEPSAVGTRSPLAQAVEEQVERLAAEAAARRPTVPSGRVGAPPVPLTALAGDGKLQQAMDLVVARLAPNAAPPAELTERALWLSGIVEPLPYMMTIIVPDGADADVLEQLSRHLPTVLEHGRYRRVAASVAPLPDRPGSRLLLLALQESFVELAPLSRSFASGSKASIAARILPPFERPALFLTAPDGSVQRLELSTAGAEDRVRANFRCASNGAWQVEIVAEDRWGDAVLANFPIFCGVPAPSSLELPPRENGPSVSNSPAAEASLVELLARDRARAGLPRLATDASLSAVARAHSEEMRDRAFFGHISPTTGSAADRLRRAGIQPMRVLENLGRATSPSEVERSLMESPSHRANIVSPDVERVGIGAALGPAPPGGGNRELYVTQLFVHLPAPLDPASADRDLRNHIDGLRRSSHRSPLHPDAELDALARDVAAAMASQNDKSAKPGGKSGVTDPAAPVERALPALGERYKWVKTVIAQAAEVAQLGSSPALLDREATHAGVAAVTAGGGASDSTVPGGGVILVVLLAATR